MNLTPYERGKLDAHINAGAPVAIVSGEGEEGHVELYLGYPTLRDVIEYLHDIRRSGRWARAVIYSHTNKYGNAGFDAETGEYRTFPEELLTDFDEMEENDHA